MGAPLPNGGRVQHVNGTAGAVASLVQPADKQEAAYLSIHNAAAGATLLVSFDGGLAFITVPAGGILEGPFATRQLHVKSAGGAAYEILWVSVV